MREVKVISSDLDGAELTREKIDNLYHIRCSGSHDDGNIQEAIDHKGNGLWRLPEGAWDRIFGGDK